MLRDSSFYFKDNRTANGIMKRASLLLRRKKMARKYMYKSDTVNDI